MVTYILSMISSKNKYSRKFKLNNGCKWKRKHEIAEILLLIRLQIVGSKIGQRD